jgi:hypothetical protein
MREDGEVRTVRRWLGIIGLWAQLASAPALAAPGGVYVVQQGDTLAGLALSGTGDSLRYGELLRANPELAANPEQLTPGMELRLPSGWRMPGQGAIESRSLLNLPSPPQDKLLERFTFFPMLGQLDRDFEVLMRRASAASDVAWGAERIALDREQAVDRIETEVDVARVQMEGAKALYDECDKAAARAEVLLRPVEVPDTELRKLEEAAKERLADAFEEERRVWEDVAFPYLAPASQTAWEDFIAAIVAAAAGTGSWGNALARHDDLVSHRQTTGKWFETLPAEDQLAFGGVNLDAALRDVIELTNDDRFREADITTERQRQALQVIARKKSCERTFADAQTYYEQMRRKVRMLQLDIGAGSADALETDALAVAERYAGVLSEVQLVQSFLSNRIWAALWWKSGVALRLTGDPEKEELGARRIAQAAAVAEDHRLPSGEVPPSVEAWLREAENEVLRQKPGGLTFVVPPLARLTVDGNEVPTQFGQADLSLAPGVHRLVFWWDGGDPIMKLVAVVEGENRDFYWSDSPRYSGDEEYLLGEAIYMPEVVPREKPKSMWVGVTPVGGVTLGRAGFGLGVTARFFPKFIGFDLGASLLVPVEPYWLEVRQDMDAFVRVHGGLTFGGKVGRFQALGGLGGYVDPLLGAGPMGIVDLSYDVSKGEEKLPLLASDLKREGRRRIRIGLTGHVGYDVTPHFVDIPRLTVTGAAGVWF